MFARPLLIAAAGASIVLLLSEVSGAGASREAQSVSTTAHLTTEGALPSLGGAIEWINRFTSLLVEWRLLPIGAP